MAKSEIEQRVAFESARRERLAVPAGAGGVLYLLSGIVLDATLKGLPTVGIVQGLEPAFRGEARPAVSLRAGEVRFVAHHAFGLIASGVLTAIAVAALTALLVFLADCTRFRRPEAWPAARPLVLIGGVAYLLLNVIHQIALAVSTHGFLHGSDFGNTAVERALLTSGAFGYAIQLVGLLAALALTVGTIAVAVGAMRAGLLPRWMGMLGAVVGLMFLPFFATATLQLIPAFWMVALALLLIRRWPSGDPPAWPSGEARPWPTQAERRGGARSGKAEPAIAAPRLRE